MGSLSGKVALVRVDFNVPIQAGVVLDKTRIEAPFRTINKLRSLGAKVVLMSHLGKGSEASSDLSFRRLIPVIEEVYGTSVVFIEKYPSEDAAEIIRNTAQEKLILLENLRFHPEEISCDLNFAKELAELGDLFVNEAFPVSHRRHASVYGVPLFLPSEAGEVFQQEISNIDNFFLKKDSPKMAIVGGAKISTKIELLKFLVKKVDKLAIGGGIAGAFLAYFGHDAFEIFNQNEYNDDVKEIISQAKENNCELIIPSDFSALINDNSSMNYEITDAPSPGMNIFDLGPATIELFKKHVDESKMVLWNGPLGLFERTPFDFGTREIAKHLAEKTQEGRVVSLVGGGDTVFALKKFGAFDKMSYGSTGGGAFLHYICHGTCPALEALSKSSRVSDIVN